LKVCVESANLKVCVEVCVESTFSTASSTMAILYFQPS
jgi:hypothetical protein